MHHLAVLVVELEEIIHPLVSVQFFHLNPQVHFSLDTETQEEQVLILEVVPVAEAVVAHQKQERLTNQQQMVATADMEF
jgi:hypothetical protein